MKYAVDKGIIDLNGVLSKMKEEEKQRILNKHKYEIYVGSDGRYRTYIPDDKKGRKLIVRTTLENLQKVLIDYYTLQEDKDTCPQLKTLKDIYPEWLKYKSSKTKSQSYIRRIQSDWNKYYINDNISNICIDKITSITIEKWFLDMIKQYNLTKKQFYNMSVIIRQIFEYCVDCNILETNPIYKVKKIDSTMFKVVKRPKNNTQVYFKDEEKSLKESALELYEKNNRKFITPLAIPLNFTLGLRIGELVALKWTDIEDGYITIQRSEISNDRITKEGKVIHCGQKIVDNTKTKAGFRSIYLTQEAKRILKLIKKTSLEQGYYDNDFIFISKYGTRITECGMSEYLKRLCNYSGVKYKSSHKIRKTFISNLFDIEVKGKKLNIDTIKTIAGHEDARTSFNNYCFETKRDRTVENLLEHISKK